MYLNLTGSENLTTVIMKCTISIFLSYFFADIYAYNFCVAKTFVNPKLFRRLLFTPV
jgi:hypothetical protein